MDKVHDNELSMKKINPSMNATQLECKVTKAMTTTDLATGNKVEDMDKKNIETTFKINMPGYGHLEKSFVAVAESGGETDPNKVAVAKLSARISAFEFESRVESAVKNGSIQEVNDLKKEVMEFIDFTVLKAKTFEAIRPAVEEQSMKRELAARNKERRQREARRAAQQANEAKDPYAGNKILDLF